MPKFYFTFGSSKTSPYQNGWVVVKAPDIHKACAAYRAYFPDVHKNIMNCCCVYDEEHFKKTEMFNKDNFGARCHAVIEMREGDFEE